MFAVIKTGGKQYRVSPGDRFTVEKLAAEPGEKVQFNDVLMLGGDEVTLGTPTVSGAAVQAEVVDQTRGPKVVSYKRRRRKASSKRTKGHRQHLTLVEVVEILAKDAGKSGVKAANGAGAARREGIVEAPAKGAKAKKADKAEKADAPKKAEKSEAPKKAAKAETTEAPAMSRPGNLLKKAKGEADDLTKISGVGPKLQEKLNENGVFHFWQIAEWTPEEVAHMDEQLSFKGRIERDDWIAQATEFAAEKK